MAARHLQKLRATQQAEPEAGEHSDDSEQEAPSSKRAPFNPFDLLSDEEVHCHGFDVSHISLEQSSNLTENIQFYAVNQCTPLHCSHRLCGEINAQPTAPEPAALFEGPSYVC